MTAETEVIDPGHYYKLKDANQTIRFMKKTGGELVYEGTTNEELIEVLINRIDWLNKQFPCFENVRALAYLGGALNALNERTSNRVKQGVEGQDKLHIS